MEEAGEADGGVVLARNDVTDPVELVLDSSASLDPGGDLLGLSIGHR